MDEDEVDGIRDVRAACVDAGEPDPLDEATSLSLVEAPITFESWVREGGFALRDANDLHLAVSPARRRRGLGASLLAEALVEEGPLLAWSHGDHPGAARLAERHGFDRIRALHVMRRRTALPLPDLNPPADVLIRSYRPDDAQADKEAIIRVNAAAFADHPEQGAMDQADLERRMSQPWFEAEGLLLAVDEGGDVLGFHWTKRHDAHTGEVYVVAVAPAAQGTGLGKALTLAGLQHLGDTDEVLLYVESDNDPAIAVYTGLGFTHAATDTHVQYARR